MNDEPRKPLEALGDEALEARIVAWVLGESSAFEAAELEDRCAQDPELKRFADQMRELHQWIAEDGKTPADPEWMLPQAKRQKVFDLLGVEPTTRLKPRKRRIPIHSIALATAACLMIGLVLWGMSASMSVESKRVSYSRSNAEAASVRKDRRSERSAIYPTEFEPPEASKPSSLSRGTLSKDHAYFGYQPNLESRGAETRFAETSGPAVETEVDAFAATDGAAMGEKSNKLWADREMKEAAPSVAPSARPASPSSSMSKAIAANIEAPASPADSGSFRLRVLDGVDQSNPGNGSGGPNALYEPDVDDEFRGGGVRTEATFGTTSRSGGKPAAREVEMESLVQSGNRSGDGAITRNSIDAILKRPILNRPSSGEGEATGKPVDFLDSITYSDGDGDQLRVSSGDGDGRLVEDALANSDRMTWGSYQQNRFKMRLGEPEDLSILNGSLFRDEPTRDFSNSGNDDDFFDGPDRLGSSITMDLAGDGLEPGKNVALILPDDEGRVAYSLPGGTDFDSIPLGDGSKKRLHLKVPTEQENRGRVAGEVAGREFTRQSEFSILDRPGDEDLVRSNSAQTQDPAQSVAEIRRNLYTAEGAFNLGKFDEAKEQYREALGIDPYNKAARRGLEKVAAAKSDYYRAAYDQTRAELLSEVDAAWELEVPQDAGLTNQSSLAEAEERLDLRKQELGLKVDSLDLAKADDKPTSFDSVRADFETSQRLLEQLKVKLVGEEMQRRISENPVIVHAEPEGNLKGPGLFSFDRRWEAKSVIQVRPNTPSMKVLQGAVSKEKPADSQAFFPTEFEVVKSQGTLDQVIDEINLTSRWGMTREKARESLEKMIDLKHIEGTDLFEIRAKAKDASEAQLIAEKVTEAYRARRTELESQRTVQALSELRQAVEKQVESVEEKRKALTSIVRNQELVYRRSNTGGTREGGLASAEEARMASRSFSDLSEEKIMLESQIETLLSYDGDQLMTYAAGLQLPENVIRVLHPQYLEAKRTLDSLKIGGLGGDHPNVKQQEEIVAGMRRDLDEGVVALRATLMAQRELAAQQLARMADQMKDGVIEIPQGAEHPKVDHTVTLDAMAEVSAKDEPFSTFSMHVSDASFKLAAAAIERGEVPAAESVRPEEFYNAFDYGDPAPSANEPVACAIEQCAHPAFPQRNLLRIAVRTGAEGRAQSVPLNLTLLLDNSGSMEREDRAEGVRHAVKGLSSLLKDGDTVTVAGFSRQPRLLADRLNGDQAAMLNGLVEQTPAEGGTNLEEALVLGGDLAKRQFKDGAQNRVVLFTDGAANLGDADPESLNRKVEELRNNGISFDAAGFGADGMNDRLLERLTRNGNGRYYVVDSADDANEGFARQLAGAFRPAAENVKVQVIFNPSRVGNYKLIGFDEHRLKKEDFRNDAVDAAEMASEEAGVALYQFEILPDGEGEVGEVSVRFRDTASGEMVERSWAIPYDPQAPAFDQAKPGLQLAGMAAFMAEKLRRAPLAEAVDFNRLGAVMGRVKAEYSGNRRVTQLEQMMNQSR